ncbi:MAG: hypothetical protein LBV06_06845 [Propionibacteriaceae bacterium]|nr:hypothetical protein [Propionibacteriaceae bacterium]
MLAAHEPIADFHQFVIGGAEKLQQVVDQMQQRKAVHGSEGAQVVRTPMGDDSLPVRAIHATGHKEMTVRPVLEPLRQCHVENMECGWSVQHRAG